MTLVAALYSAALLAILFYYAAVTLRRSELARSYAVLAPAAEQAIEIYHARPLDPNWHELLDPNPDISIAVYDKNMECLDSAGSLILCRRPAGGQMTFHGIPATFYGRTDSDGHIVIVAHPGLENGSDQPKQRFLIYLWVLLVVAAGIVSWQASRSTFEPLAELAAQAEQLSATDLSRRLTMEGAGEYGMVAAHLNRFLELLQASVQRQERFVSTLPTSFAHRLP